MALGTAFQAKVAALLTKLNATAKVVKFRNITRAGGSAVLGLGGTVTITDTVVDPQPAVRVLDTEAVAASGGILQPGDYELIFAGTIPEATLRNRQVLYGDDVLKVLEISPAAIDGIVVAWTVLARTVSPA